MGNSNIRVHYPFLDKLWLFSIVYIIWFHTPPKFDRDTNLVIWYVGLAIFFFISGCLYNTQQVSVGSFFKKIFKRLVWPSLVCYLGFYVLWLVIGRYHGNAEDLSAMWYDPLKELVIGDLELVAVPLWFVYALVWIQSTTFLILKKGSLVTLSIISLCLFALSPYVEFHYYYIHFSVRFYIWHTLGVLFREKRMTRVLQSGPKVSWLSDIKKTGIIILASQNYVIGCLKMVFAYFSIDLQESPIYMKFVVASLAAVLTIMSAWLINKVFPFVTDVSRLFFMNIQSDNQRNS